MVKRYADADRPCNQKPFARSYLAALTLLSIDKTIVSVLADSNSDKFALKDRGDSQV
jgi:hypothetical protein